MSTINFTRETPPEGHARFHIYEWAGLTHGDDGAPVSLAQLADRTVQVEGTFNSGTCYIEGSVDGTNYHTLTDPQGNALTFSVAGLEAITEVVRYIRPRVQHPSGNSVDLTITLLARYAQ